MQTTLVSYADEQMTISQQLCIKSAQEIGKIDQAFSFNPRTLGVEFVKRHKHILEHPQRGGGYGFWLWKPYIVDQAIRALPDGDILIYSDSGVEWIAPIEHLTGRFEAQHGKDRDIFLFSNGHVHENWCKAEVLQHMLPKYLTDDYHDLHTKKQVQASVMMFRINEYTREFCARWLAWSCIPGFIDDTLRGPQLPEFREHRNDQSILTNLAIEDGLKLHHWPAQYWADKKVEFPGDLYPQMFYHHRYRNEEWKKYAVENGLGGDYMYKVIEHFMKQPKK
jgi:hypothetical protein